jgi:hypothetical protein
MPRKILRLPIVLDRTGLSRSTVYQRVTELVPVVRTVFAFSLVEVLAFAFREPLRRCVIL